MQIPPKTAVIGAQGLIGRVLFEAFRKIYPDVIGTDWRGRDGSPRLDLADPETCQIDFAGSGHRWAVICAAIRNYETCENRKAYTRERNVTGTLALARYLQKQGLSVAVFSSDVVFDGESGPYSDDAPAQPVNEYGCQKRDLERHFMADRERRVLILRIGRVMGIRKGDGTLADGIARSLVAGQAVQAARDQVFTPVLVDDLSRVLMALQKLGASGVFNIAGPEPWSRLAIAQYLAKGLGADPSLIHEVHLDEIQPRVPRPKNISLTCERLRQTLPFSLTALTPCLDQVIRNYG